VILDTGWSMLDTKLGISYTKLHCEPATSLSAVSLSRAPRPRAPRLEPVDKSRGRKASRSNESNDSRPYCSVESDRSDMAIYHIDITSHPFAMALINNSLLNATWYYFVQYHVLSDKNHGILSKLNTNVIILIYEGG
jgi:hypothetical protein